MTSKQIATVTLGSAILLLLPLASTPVLPLIDFYNHIARYFVLSHLGQNAPLSANYAAAWALLPNLGLDAIATPLLAFVPPLLAAKLIVGFILLVQFSGVIFLDRALNGRVGPISPLLLLGLLHSYILNWGFSNFLLGLGLAFWNLGLWFRLRERLPLAVIVASLGALVIFFCHGFAFMIYGVMLGGIEFGRWLDSRTSRSFATFARTALVLAIQAVLPLLLFLQMPTSSAQGASGSTLDAVRQHASNGTLTNRLDIEFWYRLQTVFRVAESPYLVLDALTFITLAALIGMALWKGQMRLHRWSRPALLCLLLLCIVTPPSLFGVGYVSDRLPLVAGLLLVASLAVARPITRHTRWMLTALAAVALIRIVAITIGWSHYTASYTEFRKVLQTIPPGALVTDILPTGSDKRDGLMPRCQMYRPLAVVLNDNIAPLFASPSQQPIRIKGPLEAAMQQGMGAEDEKAQPLPGYYDDKLGRIARAARYDYVILCGRERLTKPLPPNVTVAAQAGGITLLKLH